MNPKTATELLEVVPKIVETLARMEKFMATDQSPITAVIIGLGGFAILGGFAYRYFMRTRKPAETITHLMITDHLEKFEERIDLKFEKLTTAFSARINHLEGRVDKAIDA